MKLKKFFEQPGSRVVLAESPDKLPPTQGKWQAGTFIEIEPEDGPRIGADSKDIINGVERDGYFAVPPVSKVP